MEHSLTHIKTLSNLSNVFREHIAEWKNPWGISVNEMRAGADIPFSKMPISVLGL
jgi:hypothetical protein